MPVRYKGTVERRGELERLIEAIERVVDWIERSGHFIDAVPLYRECQREATRLLASKFDQPSLSALSRRVPRLIERHPHWEPPLVDKGGGQYCTPQWFDELKPLHDRLVANAEDLCVIGSW